MRHCVRHFEIHLRVMSITRRPAKTRYTNEIHTLLIRTFTEEGNSIRCYTRYALYAIYTPSQDRYITTIREV